jgi:hypothetical protein
MVVIVDAGDVELLRAGDTAGLAQRHYGPVHGLARRMDAHNPAIEAGQVAQSQPGDLVPRGGADDGDPLRPQQLLEPHPGASVVDRGGRSPA